MVLVDPRFARLADQGPEYFARARRLSALASELQLEIVPGVCLVGRGNGAMLAMDPNLAESLPVRDALFQVRDGVARIVADPPVALAVVSLGVLTARGLVRTEHRTFVIPDLEALERSEIEGTAC